MPTFEFACDTCEIRMEIETSIENYPIAKKQVTCRRCGNSPRRIYSHLNVVKSTQEKGSYGAG